MFDPISMGISVGGSLLGGLLGKSSADENRAAQERQAAQNRADQREFAQNSIQWKVADAKKAGLHPLAAIGSPTHSFSPISLGGGSSSSSMGSAVSAMGQDISRAVAAGSTAPQQVTQLQQAMAGLDLERASLQNDLLRSQIARLNQAAVPPLPGPLANADLSGVKTELSKTESVAPGAPSQAAAVVPDVSFAETSTGLAPVPSKSVKDLVEDITIPQLMWGLRNNILPIAGINQNPPQRSAGEGKVWVFHPGLGEYQSVDKNSWWARMLARPRDLR